MKKICCALLSILILTILFTGCSNNANAGLQMRSYVFEDSADEIMKPSVTLEDGNKFSFYYSAFSSYRPIGMYEVDNNTLTLIPDDELNNIYVFEIANETLIFDAEKSSEIPLFASIPDRAVFK